MMNQQGPSTPQRLAYPGQPVQQQQQQQQSVPVNTNRPLQQNPNAQAVFNNVKNHPLFFFKYYLLNSIELNGLNLKISSGVIRRILQPVCRLSLCK